MRLINIEAPCKIEIELDGEKCHATVTAPTIDAVPVVRCKDCKWWDQINNGLYGYCHACKHGFSSTKWDISIYRKYKEDWFCADGERKDDE